MKKALLMLPLGLALASAAWVRAGEHPKEHPTGSEHPEGHEHPKEHSNGKKKKEHPAGHEHPVGSKHWNKQMRKEFNSAVEDHVREAEAFTIQDEKLDKEWALKLVGVHKKRIVHLGGKSFFACADFKTVGKKDKLDLDFYATKEAEGWVIDKVLIHKVNGKARYTYNGKNEMVAVTD